MSEKGRAVEVFSHVVDQHDVRTKRVYWWLLYYVLEQQSMWAKNDNI